MKDSSPDSLPLLEADRAVERELSVVDFFLSYATGEITSTVVEVKDVNFHDDEPAMASVDFKARAPGKKRWERGLISKQYHLNKAVNIEKYESKAFRQAFLDAQGSDIAWSLNHLPEGLGAMVATDQGVEKAREIFLEAVAPILEAQKAVLDQDVERADRAVSLVRDELDTVRPVGPDEGMSP